MDPAWLRPATFELPVALETLQSRHGPVHFNAKSEFRRTRSGRENVRYAARSLTALTSQKSVSIFEQSSGSTCEQRSMQHRCCLVMRGVNYPGFSTELTLKPSLRATPCQTRNHPERHVIECVQLARESTQRDPRNACSALLFRGSPSLLPNATFRSGFASPEPARVEGTMMALECEEWLGTARESRLHFRTAAPTFSPS